MGCCGSKENTDPPAYSAEASSVPAQPAVAMQVIAPEKEKAVEPPKAEEVQKEVQEEKPKEEVVVKPIINTEPAPAIVAPSTGVPMGVSASFLREIKAKLPEGSELTTKDVCTEIIKKETAERACAYIDLYRNRRDAEGKPYVAPATVFISHAWKYNFEEPLSIMLEYEEEHPGTYFWFDLFLNNQNIAQDLPHQWWRTTFLESIRNIGTVVVVMSPWHDPVPITRAWCLFEIMCSLNLQVNFHVRLPKSQVEPFEQGIVDDFDSVMDALVHIQAEKAESFNPHDRDMIFGAIQESVGFLKLNQMVKDQLRQWYIGNAVALAERMETSGASEERLSKVLYSLGVIFHQFGENDKAVYYGEKDLALRIKLYGEVSDKVSFALTSLGTAYKNKGNYKKAVEYGERAIAIKEKLHGADDVSLTSTLNNLCTAYEKLGDHEKAIEVGERGLKLKILEYGEMHESVANTYNNLGNAYKNCGQDKKSIEYYEKALDIKLKTIGSDHPAVANTLNQLGISYKNLGDYDKAIEYYHKALRIKLTTLGEMHHSTGNTYNNMGVAYKCKKMYPEAIEYYQKALEVKEGTIGKMHSGTASTYNNLGNCFKALGENEKAIKYYDTAVEIYMETLGPDHESTIDAVEARAKMG